MEALEYQELRRRFLAAGFPAPADVGSEQGVLDAHLLTFDALTRLAHSLRGRPFCPSRTGVGAVILAGVAGVAAGSAATFALKRTRPRCVR